MGPSPHFPSAAPRADAQQHAEQVSSWAYKGLTIAAMLWLLGSLGLLW